METEFDGSGAASDAADFDWLTLDADEEVVWADTPHPYSLVPVLVVGVPLSLFLVGIPILVSGYLSFKNTNYVVTTDALYKKTGILSRNVQRIEFDKVQDTSYSQSFLGAQFGYGSVDISTAGGSGIEMSFESVTDPQRLQTLVNERIKRRGDRTTESGGKAAVLEDILAELRAIRTAVEGEATESKRVDDATEPKRVDDATEPKRVDGEASDADDATDATQTPPADDASPTDGTASSTRRADSVEQTDFDFDASVADDR